MDLTSLSLATVRMFAKADYHGCYEAVRQVGFVYGLVLIKCLGACPRIFTYGAMRHAVGTWPR